MRPVGCTAGDLATVDESWYCNIVGRIKDMIIPVLENIYPREIEEFLFRHPAIADVQVVGVPDERLRRGDRGLGRSPARGPRSTRSEVREFCRGKIAHYKIPRHVVELRASSR